MPAQESHLNAENSPGHPSMSGNLRAIYRVTCSNPGGVHLCMWKCVRQTRQTKLSSRERDLLPILDEVIHDLSGATVFGKL